MKKHLHAENPCDSGVYWIIEEGDTLYLIARHLGVSLEALVEANQGIDPYNLQIGSKICIPQ